MSIVSIDLFKSNSIPSVSVVDVTPDIARKWLDSNLGNRPASLAHAAKLERAIREGKWKMTGDPIRFSKTGKLIDGQHRLMAILNSGLTVTCVVMRDLDDSIFDVLDSGRSRQKSDVLFIELGLPVETCKMLASATALIIDYERGQHGFTARADKGDIMEFVMQNPLAITAAEFAQALPRKCPVPRSLAAMFYFYASQTDKARADRFLERFMVGAVDGPGDNLLHLRERCHTGTISRRPMPKAHVLGALIRIWNGEVRGRPIKHAQNAIRPQDAFPAFI